MQKRDIELLKRDISIVDLIAKSIPVEKVSNKWTLFLCPFHDDTNPSLGAIQNDDGGYWKCFTCGKDGDAIAWVMEKENVVFKEAVKILSGDDDYFKREANQGKPRPTRIPKGKRPPTQEWQAVVSKMVPEWKNTLWSKTGSKALDWLRTERGYTDSSIDAWDLGFCPKSYKVAGEYWLERGVVIPHFQGVTRHWAVNVRRSAGKPKYQKMSGSKYGVYGVDTMYNQEIVFMTEGEFDAILLYQHVCDFAGVITLGANTNRLDPVTWGRFLLPVKYLLPAYDLDEAGRRGLRALMGESGRIIQADLPASDGVKDVTDFWKSGGNLTAWAEYQVERITHA